MTMTAKTAKILDGKVLAQKIGEDLKVEVDALRASRGSVPHLVNVTVGDSTSVCAYANSQKRVAKKLGIDYDLKNLPADSSQEELIDVVRELNGERQVNGIMIHKPLPDHIDYGEIANYLAVEKDVEGINATNIGNMLLGKTKMIPCTPAAVMAHIESTGVNVRGKEAVIVGASNIVGKPLSLLLVNKMATVSLCHIATSEAGLLDEYIGRADILIVAVGKAGLIKGDCIKENAIVIDVGINLVGDKVVGDVEFESAKEKASCITPVPGGVGPVTVVMLMRNGIEAYKIQNNA